ncbi:MAG: tubulin-like doman-containing protein [Thermodesulfovibrionales bacterium]
MNHYAIGIGGTGAKCIEALIHLSAAGLMPKGELYVLFVDPDKGNGNIDRAAITLQRYIDLKRIQLGAVDFLKTNISEAKPNVWSPFENEAQPTLDKFFQYNELRESNKAATHLFDVLYSPSEKATTLEKGFRGHPSIGAAVMAETVRLGQGEPWGTFRNRIIQDIRGGTGARIFLFGSIFGGTGASGFPTIATLIRKELAELQQNNQNVPQQENMKLGGMLAMPYFSFLYESQDTEMKAKSENFLINTHTGLKYYYHKTYSNIYDAIYSCGDETQSLVSTASLGGNTQKNEPHFVELYAALSAITFFSEKDPSGFNLIARKQLNQLDWIDLPDGKVGTAIKQKIGQLTRFAFSYLSVYYPMLKAIRENERAYRAPWFIDFFARENISLNNTQTSLDDLKAFCEDFLLWVANLHNSAKEEKINLINWNAFAHVVKEKDGKEKVKLLPSFRLKDFGNLILPSGKEKPNELSRLWEMVCDSKVRDSNSVGIGKFIHALYRESYLKE